MKVIVFGIGTYYREQKEKLNILDDIEIVAFADNNASLWNERIDEIIIISPNLIPYLEYDKILIMSIHVCAICEQLLALGVVWNRIITWEQFCAESVQGKRNLFSIKSPMDYSQKSILIISTDLGYNGGTFAAVYAALALEQSGISVILAAPKGDKKLIKEIMERKIDVVVWPSLPYVFDIDREWILQFDAVMVNTFQMVECAYQISKICPTIWWIHEPLEMYAFAMMKYPNCKKIVQQKNLDIYAVSKIAQRNYNKSFGFDRCEKILTLGIPDKAIDVKKQRIQDKKIVFAIIGSVCSLKAQDIFLQAVSMLSHRENLVFWIIGRMYDNEYCQRIRNIAEDIKSVKVWGELTKAQMGSLFPEIDVLVCASKEETLSITVIEAMMYRKICIVTDTTGIAEYMKDKRNGFVISCNNANALKEKIEWIMNNKDELEKIRIHARNTYEKYFNMDVFGANLKNALKDIGR